MQAGNQRYILKPLEFSDPVVFLPATISFDSYTEYESHDLFIP